MNAVLDMVDEAKAMGGTPGEAVRPYSTRSWGELRRMNLPPPEIVWGGFALGAVGLMNVQYAIGDDGVVYVLEANPRASRTVPLVSKVCNINMAGLATQVMLGARIADLGLTRREIPYVGIKEAVFPFNMFPEVDPLLGPEMRSTGEVMGSDADFHMAFLKAQMGAGTMLPEGVPDGNGRRPQVFLSIKEADKTDQLLETGRVLRDLGFDILATRGTAAFLARGGVEAAVVNKVYEGRPNIVDVMKDGGVKLVLNTTEGAQAVEDSRSMRNVALMDRIPYFTTLAASHAAALAMKVRGEREIGVKSLQAG